MRPCVTLELPFAPTRFPTRGTDELSLSPMNPADVPLDEIRTRVPKFLLTNGTGPCVNLWRISFPMWPASGALGFYYWRDVDHPWIIVKRDAEKEQNV